MSSYERLEKAYKNALKLKILNMNDIVERKNKIIDELEKNSVFNPIIWIKYNPDINYNKFLNELKSILNPIIIIPVIFIEFSYKNLTEFRDWISKFKFFDYLRIIPVLIIDDLFEINDLFNKLDELKLFNIGFKFPEDSEINEIYLFLDSLKKNNINEGIFVFIPLKIRSILKHDKIKNGYNFPICYIP
ncbi:MAG: hypothetical protein ACTSPQ_15885 [Candidatus Helarchaeota archaeon]